MPEIKAIYNPETRSFESIDEHSAYRLVMYFETEEQRDNAVKILKEAQKDGRI